MEDLCETKVCLTQGPPNSASYQKPRTERLAFRAKVAAAVSHQNPLNGSVADRAKPSLPVSHLKIELSPACLAIGAYIGIHASAFTSYS